MLRYISIPAFDGGSVKSEAFWIRACSGKRALIALPRATAVILGLVDHLVSVAAEEGSAQIGVLPVMCAAAGLLQVMPGAWRTALLCFDKDPTQRPSTEHLLDLERVETLIESSEPEVELVDPPPRKVTTRVSSTDAATADSDE